MQFNSNKIISSAKYVYLAVFFALLSGVFYPVITHSAWDPVIIGTLVLFLGLAGAVALYKAGTAEKNRKGYLIAGLAIMAVALFLVYAAIGRA
jgi:ABC-type sugar transport system permease subunit